MQPSALMRSGLRPAAAGIRARNTLADSLFYDVDQLTGPEHDRLIRQTHREGAILVVLPRGDARSVNVRKYQTFGSFRSAPGDLLEHFTIAGVGSSDVGAAALARSLANHLDAPVGAIVAGYGLADIATEALGGWFFFGAASRWLSLANRLRHPGGFEADVVRADGADMRRSIGRTDTRTLVRLLSEPERRIETLLGHSKGCLSLSYALQTIARRARRDDLERARDTAIVTTGAVVGFPPGLRRVRQYLGALDWFGRVNSSLSNEHVLVHGAWHHLNRQIPMHMDLGRVLRGDYD
jgi:hypothetical protein